MDSPLLISGDHKSLTVTLRGLANYSKTAASAFGAAIFLLILWRGNERKVG
jgi:hypothetical protein